MNKRAVILFSWFVLLAVTVRQTAYRRRVESGFPSRQESASPAAPLIQGGQISGSVPMKPVLDDAVLPVSPPVHDRFVLAETLKESIHPPDPLGVYRRERLIANTGKFTILRVEEFWQQDLSSSAPDRLLRWTVMVGDHVLVTLKEGYTQSDLEASLRRHQLTLRSVLRMPRGYTVSTEAPEPGSVPSMIRILSAEPAVEMVDADYVYTVSETYPDDPHYSSLWAMETIGMPTVWDAAIGTGGIVVAVFDTGIQLTHPDLMGNAWRNPNETVNGLDDDGNGFIDDVYGWDFYDGNNDPSDVTGHGSHVAGIVGAVGNNAIGVAGVNWNVRLMPVKFFGTNSFGQLEGYSQDAIEGMYYVIGQSLRGVPVRVTNHSWGGSGYSDMMREAFRIAQSRGILHVAAAGNDGLLNNDVTPFYPASFDLSNMIAVANVRSDDLLHPGSHYGAVSVDLAAPGSGILSTVTGGGYGNKTGTSMASPHVAGVASLLFDAFMDLSAGEVRRLILDGVDQVPGLEGKVVTGGRLNAVGAFGHIPLRIQYEPQQQTVEAYGQIPVSAIIRPGLSFAQDAVVLWNTTGNPADFSTNTMSYAGHDIFQTVLPGQPKGTAIYYMIQAVSRSGLVAVHPAGAPEVLHRIDVTHNVDLWISGHPQTISNVNPGYGVTNLAWGSVVDAVAPATTEGEAGYRWRSKGWSGAGSVPYSGSTNRVLFEIRDTSFLVWCWQEQALLTQVSDPPGILSAETWADVNMPVSTVFAPVSAILDDVEYSFIGWNVDDDRFPDAQSSALNPAAPLPAGGPRTAVARYLPSAQDLDGDGLPDWWEWVFFNHLNYGPDDDPDGDGYINQKELADRSDPTDPDSYPEGPDIGHLPLADPTTNPAPWTVAADVTDRVAVAMVVLRWRQNEASWNEERMWETVDFPGRYAASIQGPSPPGDVFSYQIVAEDAGGNISTSIVYTFGVQYPQLVCLPETASISVTAGRSAVLQVELKNTGNAPLVWETVEGWFEAVGDQPGDWTHGGPASQWHISSQESYSAPYAWFCGNPSGGLYNNLMDASLYSPPVTLGTSPRLRFMHWAEMEYDGRPGYVSYYWDGAVVEIMREGHGGYVVIDPVGGYPYRITPNPDSPFLAHQPCLGGETGGWEAVEFDLSEYAGETVRVRFRFGTDRYVTSRGWFVDDISFSWGVDWLMTPVSGTVLPGEISKVAIRLDASDFLPGVFEGYWTFRSNAPETPSVILPVTLRVTDPLPEASLQLSDHALDAFVISWLSRTGQIYNVYSATVLSSAADWAPVPGLTNLSGIAGNMSITGVIESVPMKFYRIEEQEP